MRERISSDSRFERAYGYSRAVVDGAFMFLAGTTGYDYATMTLPPSPADQARNCWTTIERVLQGAGFGLADVVRATYYVTERGDIEAVLGVCGERLADVRPAATLLVVAGLLEPQMKVEIEITAVKRGIERPPPSACHGSAGD